MTHLEKLRPGTNAQVAIICILLSLFVNMDARAQSLDWAKQLGSKDADEGTAIAISRHGNVYSAGNFQDTMDLDPGPGTLDLISEGSTDVFVSRLDSAGNFLWTKRIGGTGSEFCHDIAADADGNVYIAGGFLGVTDFDPGPGIFNLTSSTSTDAFLCKLDASGNFLWAVRFGVGQTSQIFPYPVYANAIALDDSDNVYTTGSFDGPTDFDPGPGTFTLSPVVMMGQYTTDIFVSKLDSSGGFVWAKQLGGNNFEAGYSIAIDGSGSVYTTGFFNGTVDFDPGSGTYDLIGPTHTSGLTDMFVSKLDASGNFAWAKQAGGGTGHAIAVDNAGNAYVTGDDLNDSTTIYKFDPAGNNTWSKQFGASICWSLAVDEDNNLFATGLFHGTKDMDPGPGTYNLTSTPGGASYISKLDSAGNLSRAIQLGGTHSVISKSLAVDEQGHVYTTGLFEGTADFDPGATTYNFTTIGSMDVFIHKMKPDNLGVGELSIEDAFDVYPNPTNGKFTVEFKKEYMGLHLVLSNVMGQVIDRKSVDGNSHIELEMHQAPGLYILEVYQQNGKKTVARILKN